MYREAMHVGRVQGTKFPAGVWGRAPSVTRFTRFSWMGLIPVLLKKSLSVSLNLSLTERGEKEMERDFLGLEEARRVRNKQFY